MYPLFAKVSCWELGVNGPEWRLSLAVVMYEATWLSILTYLQYWPANPRSLLVAEMRVDLKRAGGKRFLASRRCKETRYRVDLKANWRPVCITVIPTPHIPLLLPIPSMSACSAYNSGQLQHHKQASTNCPESRGEASIATPLSIVT